MCEKILYRRATYKNGVVTVTTASGNIYVLCQPYPPNKMKTMALRANAFWQGVKEKNKAVESGAKGT